jgi:hypothetical protein
MQYAYFSPPPALIYEDASPKICGRVCVDVAELEEE